MKKNGRWSAPGSVLIAGEYMITEEGGRGLALAAGGRGILNTRDSRDLRVSGRWPGGGIDWKPAESGTNSLPEIVYRKICENEADFDFPKMELEIDTGSFFDRNGDKRGFGSSAVSTLLLYQGMHGNKPIDLTVPAVDAHRAFQGGRGSGYDILCSYYGGCGLFIGGRRPTWQAARWPEGIDSWLVKGPAPVNSGEAVRRFNSWKTTDPEGYSFISRETDRVLEMLLAAMESAGERDAHSTTSGGFFYRGLRTHPIGYAARRNNRCSGRSRSAEGIRHGDIRRVSGRSRRKMPGCR